MNISIINGIGNSMKYWANYICAVQRGKILNEGSIKYGISEYLVASENMDSNRNATSINQPSIKEVEFEKSHDVFKRRRSDLYFKASENDKTIEIYFEFKYLRGYSLPYEENNRYIDDLFRLASLLKNKSNCECYFMLVGNSETIKNILKTNSDTTRLTIAHISHHTSKDINECLSLEYNHPQTVKLINLKDDKDQPHLARFITKYEYKDEITKLENNDELNITLKYPKTSTNEMISDIGVYIWQIKIN